ncbi:DUF1836 domain-containing protein [Eubacteriales bacterium OttesenSCG-928-A19]|nr:DUF1836 domain-containing protein [Eubacteriales bacterium OttesenSCG-928-A19]
MPWYEHLMERYAQFQPAAWDELPDLGLYMDQVITFLERQFRPLYGESRRIVTPAMINNYVKSGLISRPVGKKYSREQLAQLSMLCSLKQAISLEDARLLLAVPEDGDIRTVYEAFCQQQRTVAERLGESLVDRSPMECAIWAASFRILCEEMLHAES